MSRNGYAWWYLDGLSDNGRHGFTIIAFIGSVFSPYYAMARGYGEGDPENFCALNVAIYGPGARWAMTERPRAALSRTADMLAIGPSSVVWDGTALTVNIEETAVPLPLKIRGRIRLHPAAVVPQRFPLDPHARHIWQPIAPFSRVEVDLEKPSLRWSGHGYFDMNAGAEPLEDGFSLWNWSRATLKRGATVLYDVIRRSGETMSLALKFNADGAVEEFPAPPVVRLPRTLWLMPRLTRADAGHGARVLKTLEDTPFYTRSVLASHLCGEAVTGVHESLSLDRFRTTIVQLMLPYRMPRR